MSEFVTMVLNKLNGRKSDLGSPGTYERLHVESRGVLAANFMIDGAKFDLNSQHNQNFQTTHSFGWGSAQAPSSYHFGSMYATPQLVMHGLIDHNGNLQARGNYNWLPVEEPGNPAEVSKELKPPASTSISKIQGQISDRPDQTAVQLEHEYTGSDFSVSLKGVNMNPFARPVNPRYFSAMTGIYSASILHSVSQSLALGAEYTLQKQFAESSESAASYSLRWAPPPCALPRPPSLPEGVESPYMPINPLDSTQVFTTTWAPASGLLHSSYWRRLNQRLEVVAEIQMLLTPSTANQPGRRDGIAAVGFKLDTVFATIRTAIESTGKLSTVLEEKVTPNLSFQLNSEIDYSKSGAGRVGFGFTFEA